MFPKTWTSERIKVEVDQIFRNRTLYGNKWYGTTPSGVKVEGFLHTKVIVYPSSKSTTGKISPTFDNPKTRENAIREAMEEITENKSLPPDIRKKHYKI